MRIWLIGLTIAAGLGLPAAASGNVKGWHYTYGDGPLNDRSVPLGAVSVRDMTCSAGLKAISNSRLLRDGAIATRGFSCYTLKRYFILGTTNLQSGAIVRCVSGRRAFRFSWAT
jgi:hypothetical protein